MIDPLPSVYSLPVRLKRTYRLFVFYRIRPPVLIMKKKVE